VAAGPISGRAQRGLHVDDDDAAVLLFVLVLGLSVALALTLAVTLVLVLGLPPLVTRGDLQPGLFLTPALFFLAASDLFDDPGFEHDEDL
jgi:hypothetical protein